MNREEVCAKCAGWCCYRFWTSDLESLLESYKDFPEDLAFIKENFKLLRKRKCPGNDVDGYSYMYTCRAYDVEKGICARYEDRPRICRSFCCPPAIQGFVPIRRDFPVQARAMYGEGVKPNCGDGRKHPRKNNRVSQYVGEDPHLLRRT